jgi:O-antigen ligase
MTYLLLFIFCLSFGLLTWKKFSLAVGIFIILLPSYLVRFRLGPLPSTLLELSFGIIFLIWIIKYRRADWPQLKQFFINHKTFLFFYCLFFIASLIGIFVSDMWYYSLGQWRAYFLEPMLFFLVLIARKDILPTKKYILFLGLSTLSISIFGIIQKYTSWGIPTAEWQNLATRRVTSFFTSPNAVGLYLGPILPLLLIPLILHFQKAKPIFGEKIKSLIKNPALWVLIISLVALFFTKSLGSWLALILGGLIFAFLIGYKKTAVLFLVSCFLISLIFSPVRSFILTKSQSSLNRVTLWQYSFEFLTASPKNFIFGTGLRQFFRKIQKPHYNVQELERLIYPHNIFLNFWTEIGLFGMVGFVGILYSLIITCHNIARRNQLLGATLFSVLTILIVHGLIDVPYFKNDLAMLFWIITALIFSSEATTD